ncbi:MAG: hypothetical protein ACOCWR_08205 [Oceanidesulfovibrio sp.]
MVKLGFIKDADQCPPEFARVYVSPAQEGACPTTEVRSWPNSEGEQLFEIAFIVPRGENHLQSWVGYMAETLERMGWDRWWIDTLSLSQVLNRYIVDAVWQWGEAFWPLFKKDGVALIQVGMQPGEFHECAKKWANMFAHVSVDDEYDFERITLELEAKAAEERANKRLSVWLPRLFGARNRTS